MDVGQHSKIYLIGFSPELKGELLGFCKKGNNFLIESVDLEGEREEFEVSTIPLDASILIINSIGFSTPTSKILSEVRSKFPLIAPVVLLFNKNYYKALEIFRAGGLDILNYPLDEEGVQDVFSRLQSRVAIMQEAAPIENLLRLVNTFGSFQNYEDIGDLNLRAHQFLVDHFQNDSYGVFSFPKGKLQLVGTEPNYRIEFGSEEKMNFLSKLKLQKVLNPGSILYESELMIFRYPDNEEEESLLLFSLHDNPTEVYVGALKVSTDEFLKNQRFWEQYCQTLQNAYDYLLNLQVKNRMTSLAHTDDVTGLYNQRKLNKDLDGLTEGHSKNGQGFSVLFIDIDHFKNINDGHGHLIGSLILVKVARELRKMVRDTDLLYRYGGDEFVIILPESTTEYAQTIGERILTTISRKDFKIKEYKNLKLSFSIGVANFPTHARTKEEILQVADDMMYAAKKGGRGRVCLAKEPSLDPKKSSIK